VYHLLSTLPNLPEYLECDTLGSQMFPVLFSIGKFSISSFGFFLALAFLFATFLVWRLARAWDLDEEKILDLILLSFFGGIIGARIFFVLLNFEAFSDNLMKILLVTRYPGLSFWGGLLGGWLTLYFFLRRKRLDFWQYGDIASVGFLGGMILGNIGCFLGGCGFGIISNWFFAIPVVGVVGKRFPVQLVEALILLFILWKTWPMATKFHFHGKIVSIVLIFVGLIKLLTEFFRENRQGGAFLSVVLIILGVFIFYKTSKRSFRYDLSRIHKLPGLIFSKKEVSLGLPTPKKSWYNLFTKLLRRARVKPTPKDFQQY
jgi:phosphatidylglycerol---prolipoprotein diacylglyceryl transferase